MTEIQAEPVLTRGQMRQRIAELEAKTSELTSEVAAADQRMVEFKALVRTEAMAMAQQHNMCGQVERTLAKVGIGNEKQRVEVTTVLTRVASFTVPKELMDLISEDDFIGWAVRGTVPRNRTLRDFRQVTRAEPPTETTESTLRIVEVVTPEPGAITAVRRPRRINYNGFTVPDGFFTAYASDDGRVLHLIRLNQNEEPPEARNGVYREFRTVPAIDGVFPSSYWRATSSRAERPVRLCRACQNRIGQ